MELFRRHGLLRYSVCSRLEVARDEFYGQCKGRPTTESESRPIRNHLMMEKKAIRSTPLLARRANCH